MREYMTEKEIDDLVKEIMDLPRVESSQPVSTIYGFDVDTLINTLRDFKRLPTYDEVLKQNQKYKEVINNAIKRLNDLIVFWKKYNPIDNTMQVEQFKGVIDILKEV